jgi:hypothetical protein
MHRFAPALALFAALSVFSGCSAIESAQKAAATGFHASFRTSFKNGFVKSCKTQPGTSQSFCACAADELEAKFTDEQLMNLSGNGETAIRDAANACAGKRLSVPPTRSSQSTRRSRSGVDPARIDASVSPYYNSKGPSVRVGRYSAGLASIDDSETVATIQSMKRHWNDLSFPELYVGAIRLYDLGYRDESVYWFYTAQYRGRLVNMLLDPSKTGSMGDPGFELQMANGAFMQTAGTWINGYAFADSTKLAAVIRKVQHEGDHIGDLHKTYPGVTFVPQRSWQSANGRLAAGMDSLIRYARENADGIKRERLQRGIDPAFAHLSSKTLPDG